MDVGDDSATRASATAVNECACPRAEAASAVVVLVDSLVAVAATVVSVAGAAAGQAAVLALSEARFECEPLLSIAATPTVYTPAQASDAN